jgi:hypothetical protein
MTTVAVLLAYTSFILPSGIGSLARQGEEMFAITATFGTVLFVAALVLSWMVISAVRQDWNTVFEPTCYFRLEFVDRTVCAERAAEIARLCTRKNIPCQIVSQYGSRDDGYNLRLGFIDEEDMMVIRLSV